MFGEELEIDAEPYYKFLNILFEYLEKTFGYTVVIAAHPRSQYDQHEKMFFKDRLLIKGETPELIRRSQGVILHCSTAVSFSVLMAKPTLHVSFSSIAGGEMDRSIKAVAKQLGNQVCFLDSVDWKENAKFSFDEAYRERFIHRYLKNRESQDLPFAEIIEKNLFPSHYAQKELNS